MKVFDPKVVEYVPEEGSEVGKDLVSRVTQRFATELDQGKLHNSRFIAESTLLTDSSLQNKLVTKTEEDEVRSLFHNASVNTSIDTFVKRKYAASRINLGLGMNSPDIILFRECLKKNVLPPGSLDLEWKSSDISLHGSSSYDHAASVQHLAQISSSLLGRTTNIKNVSLDASIFNDSAHSTTGHEGEHGEENGGKGRQEKVSSGQSIGSLDSSDVLGIENEQIYSINLNNKGIGNERGICLSSALSYCPHLCVIKLSNNRLTDRSLSMILNAIFNITYCEELDISCNAVGDISTKCLAAYLQVSHCALRKLSVRKCKMDDVNCTMLCEALHKNESLEILDISANNLGKYEVILLYRPDELPEFIN